MYFFWEYSQEQVGSSGRKNRRSMEVIKVGEVNFGAFAPARTAAYACGLRPSSLSLVLAGVAISFGSTSAVADYIQNRSGR
jgi:hypothetical protein